MIIICWSIKKRRKKKESLKRHRQMLNLLKRPQSKYITNTFVFRNTLFDHQNSDIFKFSQIFVNVNLGNGKWTHFVCEFVLVLKKRRAKWEKNLWKFFDKISRKSNTRELFQYMSAYIPFSQSQKSTNQNKKKNPRKIS